MYPEQKSEITIRDGKTQPERNPLELAHVDDIVGSWPDLREEHQKYKKG